jgi:DNA-binding transcriptional MerR regulator
VAAEAQRQGSRRATKAPGAFRTISEVAADLDVSQHVLRFWESKFAQVRPLKRGGGRRYYRPEDVALLRTIRDLLYDEGYTIRGVQKVLREGGHKPEGGANGGDHAAASTFDATTRRRLAALADELAEIRKLLK